MPPGKLAAQAGHAFLGSLQDALQRDPTAAHTYITDPPGTKIVLAAPSLEALKHAHAWCQARGISCAWIEDSGHVLPPHFTGAPIATALGFGPAPRAAVKALTKQFSLHT